MYIYVRYFTTLAKCETGQIERKEKLRKLLHEDSGPDVKNVYISHKCNT